MQQLRKAIPSPGNLFIFEAAARLGSFTRAAEELGITQAAVSYGVRGLERSLGMTLFVRDHRAVSLSEVGRRFYRDVAEGLGHIERSVAAIRRMQADRHVTLSVSTAFCSLWMLPRIARFRQLHPDIDLRFLASDRDVDPADANVALAIQRGKDAIGDCEAALFATERIFPVCTPGYLARAFRARRLRLADISALKLIHLEEPHRYRPTWTELLAARGLGHDDGAGGLRLNDYALVIQATLEGQGVALGWDHLVSDLVARGTLVRPIDVEWQTDVGFWLIWNRELSPEAERVRAWLLDPATHAAGVTPA